MSDDTKQKESELQKEPGKQVESRRVSKKERASVLTSYTDIMEQAEAIHADSPQAFDEYCFLAESVRILKDLSNDQASRYLTLMEEKLGHLWVPFLTRMAVSICNKKQINDSKFVYLIRTVCKTIFEKHGITEGNLTNAEKNLCFLKDGKYITQFLIDAEKSAQKAEPIKCQDLACLTFVCFSLFCNQNLQRTDYITCQLLIDRTIAEYFSDAGHSKTREKDLAGKTLGRILSAKAYSSRKLSELTFLYSGTTETLNAQEERIRSLEETNKAQLSKISVMIEKSKAEKVHFIELQDQLEQLKQENKQLVQERIAAEDMLSYEKNKFQKQLQTKEEGLAEQLSGSISLELQALRDLIEYLEEDDQRRFRRRLDRIDRYLEEFGGEQ